MNKTLLVITVLVLIVVGYAWNNNKNKNACMDEANRLAVLQYKESDYPNITERSVLQDRFRNNYIEIECN